RKSPSAAAFQADPSASFELEPAPHASPEMNFEPQPVPQTGHQQTSPKGNTAPPLFPGGDADLNELVPEIKPADNAFDSPVGSTGNSPF
ncbi:MAG: hypothetical protein KDA84_05920, partial [Planctomycetaceae bacterium]|nr:hypothetical protein [Planctomycetaceae bacterium]